MGQDYNAGRTAILAAVAAVLMSAGAAQARPVTADDYRRAEAVLDRNLRSTVLNAKPKIHWLGERDLFWYASQTKDGSQWLLVDAATGAKSPLFDAKRLRAALGEAAPATLDVVSLSGTQGALSAVMATSAGAAICDLTAYHCTPVPAAVPSELRSPDGSRAVFADKDDLWLQVGAAAPRRLTKDGAPFFSYGKLPDFSLASLPRLRHGVKLPPIGVSWSPDGKRVVGQRADERAIEPYPFLESVPQNGSARPILYPLRIALPGDRGVAAPEAFVIDVASGEKRIIQPPAGFGFSEFPYAWSPDGTKFWALGVSPNLRSGALIEVDAATGASRIAISNTEQTSFAFNVAMYSGPNVRIVGGGKEAIWFSQRDGVGRLYLYDLATGRLKRTLTPGPGVVWDIVNVDEKARRVDYVAAGTVPGADPYLRKLYSVSLDGGAPHLLTPDIELDHELDGPPSPAVAAMLGLPPGDSPVSPSGRYFVDTASSVSKPSVTRIRSAADGRVISELERADASALYAAGWRAPERFKVKAADGKTDIWGVISFPAAYDPKARAAYPVIDALYGGPQAAVTPTNFAKAAYAGFPGSRNSLAELGFVVVTLDGRGTPGRTKAFQDFGHGDFAEAELEDHVAAIRQLGQAHPALDLDRVGVHGHSFGGYVSTRAMLRHPDFYRVGVSSAAPQNYQAMYSGIEAVVGFPDYGKGELFRPSPNVVPENWRALDNASLAGKLNGKLMIVYSDTDENALPAATLQFADALIKAGKRFDLLYLPNLTHDFVETDAYFTQRLWDYFVENLAGQKAPGDYRLKFSQPAEAGQ